MKKPTILKTERVDDIPLLLAQLERMGVQELLDQHFPTHGNWQGLSLGQVAIVWLSHILSQADHRMNQVQSWAEQRIESLGIILGQEVRALDLSDDRLQSVLFNLSKNESWSSFEQALSQRQLQVYDLKPERVRLDSTSVSGFWDENKEGLFRYGHSKDHRPDLPQMKLMMATLDPLGLPIASEIVAGNSADDPLYEPAIAQVRKTLGQRGMLYVGDCKMGSSGTRYFIQAGNDYYLCPLSKTQVRTEELTKYVAESKEAGIELENISYAYANGKTVVIAKGYEQVYSCSLKHGKEEISWSERRLIVYSIAHGQSQKQALQSRIETAQKNLELLNQNRLGKKPLKDFQEFIRAAEEIITKNRVQSLFNVSFTEDIEQIHQRKYKERPAGVIEKRTFQVKYTIESDLVEQQMELLGWRVYATNHPKKELSLADAVVAYRQEYLIEHCFGRLKGQPLSLRPMFLQREDHIKGLMRLLSIGLRLLTLVEFQVKRALEVDKSKLNGIYAGNPRRATAQPTTERLLANFKEITLVFIAVGTEIYPELTTLNPLQQQILKLLNFPNDIYTCLSSQSDYPP
ncbi:IS1634 family transposase [Chamaesiphon sp.]|uniref:IS1634 family transposase n=1 Tax=Chamaesiphon sp. TaxID=2814140 RepID=UPI0035940BF5